MVAEPVPALVAVADGVAAAGEVDGESAFVLGSAWWCCGWCAGVGGCLVDVVVAEGWSVSASSGWFGSEFDLALG